MIYELTFKLGQGVEYVENMNVIAALNLYSYITDKNKLNSDVQNTNS